MKNASIMLDHQPPAVVFERLPNGEAVVRLYDNIQTATDIAQPGEMEPGAEPGGAYTADEVMFMLPTAQESIATDFSSWWKYGEAWEGQEQAPTVEERLAVMEDFMVAMMEG